MAIRIINKANTLTGFSWNRTLKSMDIVYLKTLEIPFCPRNKNLPLCLQKLFKFLEGHYNLRGLFSLKDKARTNVKRR